MFRSGQSGLHRFLDFDSFERGYLKGDERYKAKNKFENMEGGIIYAGDGKTKRGRKNHSARRRHPGADERGAAQQAAWQKL